MAIDNVTFRFRIDTAKAEQTLRQLEATVRKLGGTAVKTSQDVTNLSTRVQDTGSKAAASAVNFQTATQGMLNLSTASVQTFTSISNLDRANNRAKMSVIAVARAEDLLANKIERQNAMRKAGETSSQKYLNISKEIATAEADLIVKKEKMAIEQAAVNDVYMLFVTNIANVVVSSFQTISILNKEIALTTKIKTAALKIHEAATWSNIRAQAAHIKSTVAMNITTKIGTAITLGFAGSIKAATVAMKAFAVAHPALIAATAVMTGALIAYEANVLNLKDAINSLLPKQESFKDGVDETRDSIGKFDEDLEKLGDTVKVNFARSLEDATSVALAFRLQIDRINDGMGKMNANIQRDMSQGQKLQQWTQSVSQYHNLQSQKKTKNFFDQIAAFFDFVPQTFGEEQPIGQLQRGTIFAPSQFDIPPPNVIDATFGLPTGTIEAGIEAGQFTLQQATDAYYAEKGRDPIVFLQQQELLRAQKQARALSPAVQQAMKKVQEVAPLREQLQGMTVQRLVTDKRDPLVGQMRETGIPQLDRRLFQLGLLKGDPAENIKKTLENRLFPGVGGISEDEFSKVMTSKMLEKGPIIAAVDFAGINNLQDKITQTQYTRLLAAQKGVGDSFMLTQSEQRIFEKIGKGEIEGNRAEVLIRTGIDVGEIANTISSEEALRIGHLQKLSKSMSGMTGGFTDSFLGTLTQQGKSYRKMQTEHALGGMEFGAGFFKSAGATAAYQVPRGSIATPAHIRFAIARKDSFNNSLGGLIMNELNSLKGSGQMVYSSAHRSLYKSREFRGVPGRDVIREAVRLGIKGNVEFMDAIKAIPDVDREAEDNIQQAHAAIRQAEAIANDYISMVNSAKSSIGFTDAILRRATAEGHSGASMYANISLLSAAKRTNFSNTEIIEESKAKLALTNSQIFAIRFNATRGDTELQDRLRYVDQLEAMSSGTSPL